MGKIHKHIAIIECPRDAMQGWPTIIPTHQKIEYLNLLLKVGFDVLDCVSFVSPKAIPQMADSQKVLDALEWQLSPTKLLAIVANKRGGEQAVQNKGIHYLGYPFSISETFQQKNANSTIEESWQRVMDLQNLCIRFGKELLVYISMGFGNPYGDPYNESIVEYWVAKLKQEGIKHISLADTVGLAEADNVNRIVKATIGAFPDLQIGVHLHSTTAGFAEKMDAALLAGCQRFDGALKGIGGCPMANTDLVGNLDTERMVDYLHIQGYSTLIQKNTLQEASFAASALFG
jgi:hydroxymethylglutaryl-CoA lyase